MFALPLSLTGDIHVFSEFTRMTLVTCEKCKDTLSKTKIWKGLLVPKLGKVEMWGVAPCGVLWSIVTSCGVLWSIVASCGVLWHLACPNNRSACRLAAGLVTPKVLTAKQVFYLKMVPSICLRLSDLSNHIVMNSVPIQLYCVWSWPWPLPPTTTPWSKSRILCLILLSPLSFENNA